MSIKHWGKVTLVVAALAVAAEGWAQSAAEIVDQARARARQVEEIKKLLDDPDQNVRVAAFDTMVGSDDPLMRDLALDAGLNSTDQVLRAVALRHTVLGLAQLTIALAVDDSQSKEAQESARSFQVRNGSVYTMMIDDKGKDLSTGSFHRTGHAGERGNVSGLVVTFSYGSYSGELQLQDDNSLAGTVYFGSGQTHHKFKASAPLR